MQSLVGGRFALERAAGAGGMARVFRARDVTTGELVAVKLLHAVEAADLRRFDREISALRGLAHPSIVRYVAHGIEPASGEPFLAIEWLDGIDLATRLELGPLTVDATLALGRTIADALAAAHARGIIHRDIKPGNIFLVDNDPARAKLLDFGLAHDFMTTAALTRTGDLLGTPLYMAPEQARGDHELDIRVDFHALGAVLYTCLVGRPPFQATNLVGLLAKVAVDVAPRVRASSPDVPETLDELVARMLAKSPSERPTDGRAVADALEAIAAGQAQPAARSTSISPREQRVVCILLATSPKAWPSAFDVTQDSRGSSTLRLADGTMLVTFTGPESPADLATRAVRSAIERRGPDTALSLATGRAVIGAGAPVGEAIDRAARELGSSRGMLRIDAATAGLVEGRFELERDGETAIVHAERGTLDSMHTLLGKPTRCVGRDRELAAIEGFFAECADDGVARVVLVTADAGIGKSRLAREVATRLGARSATVLVGRAESTLEGVPFALLGDAIERAAGFLRDDNVDARRTKLVAIFGEVGAELVGEVIGVPSSAPSEQLHAARENPSIMFDQLRRVVEAWLVARSADGPVALVLEDIHWADPSSITLLDVVLRGLAPRPVLVLALARPTVQTRWPSLWSEHRPHVMRLDPLSPRASERLVRDALDTVDDSLVRSIVERAGGNALFLEELVRAASSPTEAGDDRRVPLGIVGTLQLRFDTLSAEARRAMRAASVYGEQFERAAVAAIVPGIAVDGALSELVAAELVRPSGDGFAFRHALVRDAAYTLLADEDRAIAHGLAARYLEAAATESAAVLALHYELARDAATAATWYERAAEHALGLNDLAGARAHAEHAQQLAGDVTGGVALVLAEVAYWRGELARASDAALIAIDLLPRNTVAWFTANGIAITSTGQLGNNGAVVELLDGMVGLDPPPGTVSSYVSALARGCTQLLWTDRLDPARRAFDKIEQVRHREALATSAEARVALAGGYLAYTQGRADLTVDAMTEASTHYRRVGAVREALQAELLRGMYIGFSGQLERAIGDLEAVVTEASLLGADYLRGWAQIEIAMMLCALGRGTEAMRLRASIDVPGLDTPLFRAGTAMMEGWAAFREQDIEGVARSFASIDLDALSVELYRPLCALEALVTLQQGNAERAFEIARRVIEGLLATPVERADLVAIGATMAVHVLVAVDGARARALVHAYRARLRGVIDRIPDPNFREPLEQAPWNRLAFELAATLDGAPD